MISAFHLIWIIPLCTIFGFVLGAVMAVGKQGDITDKHSKE